MEMIQYISTLVCCFLLLDICKISLANYNILFDKKIKFFCLIMSIFGLIFLYIADSIIINIIGFISLIIISLVSLIISNILLGLLLKTKLFIKLYYLQLNDSIRMLCIKAQKESLMPKVDDLAIFIKNMNENNIEEKNEVMNRIDKILDEIIQGIK